MEKQISRQLKIYGSNRSSDNKEVPQLRISGVWIEQLGFKVGDTVSITTREKLLIIEPAEAPGDYEVTIQKALEALYEINDQLK